MFILVLIIFLFVNVTYINFKLLKYFVKLHFFIVLYDLFYKNVFLFEYLTILIKMPVIQIHSGIYL